MPPFRCSLHAGSTECHMPLRIISSLSTPVKMRSALEGDPTTSICRLPPDSRRVPCTAPQVCSSVIYPSDRPHTGNLVTASRVGDGISPDQRGAGMRGPRGRLQNRMGAQRKGLIAVCSHHCGRCANKGRVATRGEVRQGTESKGLKQTCEQSSL